MDEYSQAINCLASRFHPDINTASLRGYRASRTSSVSYPPHCFDTPSKETAPRLEVTGFTVDGASSQDLDDAIWAQTYGNQGIIWIHIADPTENIPLDSATERTCRARGGSLYLPQKTIPMIDSQLSYSLLENRSRNTITVEVSLRAEMTGLQIERVKIYQSSLTSLAKLSYESAEQICLFGKSHPLYFPLKQAVFWGELLNYRRQLLGAIGSVRRNGIFYDEDGNRLGYQNRFQSTIAELMILANSCVAAWFDRQGLSALYRNHYALDSGEQEIALGKIPQDRRAQYYHRLSKAQTQNFSCGHFALAVPHYLHFTSPLRRYSDFVNHRLLKAALGGQKPPYSNCQLAQLGQNFDALKLEQKEQKASDCKKHFLERAIKMSCYLKLNQRQLAQLIKLQQVYRPGLEEYLRAAIANRELGDYLILVTLVCCDYPALKLLVYEAIAPKRHGNLLDQIEKIFPELEISYTYDRPETHKPIFNLDARLNRKVEELSTTIQKVSLTGSGKKVLKQRAAAKILRSFVSLSPLGSLKPKKTTSR